MKKIVFSFFCFSLFACTTTQSPQKNLEEVLETDKEFSKLCEEKGMPEAFLKYAADDVIKMQQNDYPVIGKENLKKMFDDHAEDGVLKFGWEPVKSDISSSGDLAYTFGNWKIFMKGDSTVSDTTIYGNYVSIWKKQKDGSWKFVLDGGNATPGPEEN